MTLAERAPVLQPTTIDRGAAPSGQHIPMIDAILLSLFHTFDQALGFVVNDAPDGKVIYLIVTDRDAEDAAYDLFARATGLMGGAPHTFGAVPVNEADHLEASPGARAYSLS